jgi:hypothetical protein
MSHIALRGTAARITVVAVLAGLAGLTCLNPTDRSSEVYVSLQASDPLLAGDSLVLQGTQATLRARAWQRISSTDSAEVRNVAFRWLTSDATTATVQGQEGGTARLTGVSSGRATITVAAIAFQGSKPATFPVRVSTPFKLDSIRADTASYGPVATFNGDATHHTVKYGQLLTFYGVGVRGIFFASLGNVLLVADTFSFKGVAAGVGQMSFWVPWPAQTGKPVALALGGNAFDTTTIRVFHRDIYKVSVPNDTLPRRLSLDGPGPIAQLPFFVLADPALAFEEFPRTDTAGADWYRFTRTDTTTAITLIVTSAQTGNLSEVLLSDSIVYTKATNSYAIGANAWTIGIGEYDCRGRKFLPAQSPPDSLIIALHAPLPGHVLHLLPFYTVPGSYGLFVVNGYVTVDTSIHPDRFEDNRTCGLADANFLDPARNITVDASRPFRDSTLTIDNPHAVDWYRFHVTPAALQTVQIQSRPLPFTAGLDSSAIDLYVLSTDTLAMLGKATAAVPGARDSLNLSLATGDYYVVVVDFAGVPTRYAVCIVVGLFPHCDPATTAAPPLGVSAAERLPSLTPPSAGHGPRPRAAPRSSSGRRAPWRR